MDKLEIVAVNEEDFFRESDTLVLCVKLNDKWGKPLKEIGFGFDDVMEDLNKGITTALWRLNLEVDKKVDLMFDPNTQIDNYQRRKLESFIKEQQ